VRELGGVLRIEPADPSCTAIVVDIPLIEGQRTLATAFLQASAATPGAAAS